MTELDDTRPSGLPFDARFWFGLIYLHLCRNCEQKCTHGQEEAFAHAKALCWSCLGKRPRTLLLRQADSLSHDGRLRQTEQAVMANLLLYRQLQAPQQLLLQDRSLRSEACALHGTHILQVCNSCPSVPMMTVQVQNWSSCDPERAWAVCFCYSDSRLVHALSTCHLPNKVSPIHHVGMYKAIDLHCNAIMQELDFASHKDIRGYSLLITRSWLIKL